MATYRYWRANLYRQSGGFRAIAEMALAATSGGSNLVGSGTASASAFDSGHAAASAFDSSTATYWAFTDAATPTWSWLQYDLGSEQTVLEVKLTNFTSGGTQAGFIQASHDGVTWDYLTAAANLNSAASAVNTLVIPTTALAPAAPILAIATWLTRTWPTSAPLTLQHSGTAGYPGTAGPGYIAGEVDITGTPNTPVSREVRLYHRLTGRLIAVQWSDPITGAYRFGGLRYEPFFVVAIDYQLNYNAVIKDNVVPT